MNNFERRPDGHFRYRTGTSGNVIEIEVYYLKDGRRGIRAAIRPIELKDNMMSFVLMSGKSAFLKALARKNDRETEAIAGRVDSRCPAIAELFQAGDKDAALAMLVAAATVQDTATAA